MVHAAVPQNRKCKVVRLRARQNNVFLLHLVGHGNERGFGFSMIGGGREQIDPTLFVQSIMGALKDGANFECIFLNMCESAAVAEPRAGDVARGAPVAGGARA